MQTPPNYIPLADRMRPQTLDQVLGQEHLTTPGKILHSIIHNSKPVSLIFWGPPGTGKTTLAWILARSLNGNLIHLSAVTSGVKDIRQAVTSSQTTSKITILFIDEIHRFNKSQQDYLLPHVESGTLILIGATTENPSFQINNALLSRCRVVTLKPLTEEPLAQLIKTALVDSTQGLGLPPKTLTTKEINLISSLANQDARTALNILELAHELAPDKKHITQTDILEAAQRESLYYDRQGDEHYNTISAFIKSMRASQTDAALYYLARMVHSGEDPLFIARRIVIFASEDIGIANSNALLLANQAFRSCEIIGYPECAINLAHAVVYMCQSPKDRSSYDAYSQALSDAQTFANLPIPLHLRNAPTKLMKELDYGKGYKMYDQKSYLPDKLKNKKYFKKS